MTWLRHLEVIFGISRLDAGVNEVNCILQTTGADQHVVIFWVLVSLAYHLDFTKLVI
jgi:hypothetical protein